MIHAAIEHDSKVGYCCRIVVCLMCTVLLLLLPPVVNQQCHSQEKLGLFQNQSGFGSCHGNVSVGVIVVVAADRVIYIYTIVDVGLFASSL